VGAPRLIGEADGLDSPGFSCRGTCFTHGVNNRRKAVR